MAVNDAGQWLQEAKHAAGLHHPGIVTVYDADVDNGRPYIVAQYVEGRTLDQVLHDGPLVPSAVAELLAAVADALGHAHQQGIVHRDLKPTNILIDKDGRPHVADFGAAMHDASQFSALGQSAGTVEFMSPEQLPGESRYVDGRADIWGLGVIMYQALVGRLPFQGQSREELFHEIRHRRPKPLRQISGNVPKRLEQICSKCLEKRMEDRYSSAADLAEDLRCWLRGSSWRNHRALAGGLIAAAVLLVAMAATALHRYLNVSSNNPPVPVDGFPRTDLIVSTSIDQFRIHADAAVHVGRFGIPSGFQARFDDDIRARVELSQPAYCYLVAYNADGSEQLCVPDSPDVVPERCQSLEFPPTPDEFFPLTDGVGTQAFVVVASREALPSFRQWSHQRGRPPWNAVPSSELWEFSRGKYQLVGLARERDTVRKHPATARPPEPPPAFQELCEFFAGRPGIESVYAVAFPVNQRDSKNP
jgi:hypothetical protein